MAPAQFDGVDPNAEEEFETPVTSGHCKLQWKPHGAMRWHPLSVDYEMAGKRWVRFRQAVVSLSREFLGREPPAGFNYELFLDENGQKISKTKGNGLTIERMASLRQSGEPRVIHVPEADSGEATLFRRNSAYG